MPDEQNIYVISTIVTTGTKPGVESMVYATVNAMHTELADKLSPPTPSVKRWRVVVSTASLREGPGVDKARRGYAYNQDVLTQVSLLPDWLETDKGWILLKQVEAI